MKTSNGVNLVKFAYWALQSESPPALNRQNASNKWKAYIHDSLKMSLWGITTNILPTKLKLYKCAPNIVVIFRSCNYVPRSSLGCPNQGFLFFFFYFFLLLLLFFFFDKQWCLILYPYKRFRSQDLINIMRL